MNTAVSIHGATKVTTTSFSSVAWHLKIKQEGKGTLDITFFGKNKFGLIQAIKKAESERASEALDRIRRKFIPE